MSLPTVDHTATIWMSNDIPTRMVYAGRRWRVTDMPTRLRHSSWSVVPGEAHAGLYGWRFQGTDDDGLALVFDVYKGEDGWLDISHTQDIDVILDDDYFESVARSALEKALRDERIPAAQRTRRTRLLLEKFHSTRTA